MRSSRTLIAMLVVAAAAAAGTVAQAQGTSAIEVSSITLSPSQFKPGDTVTIRVDLKNGGSAATGAGTVFVDVFKADSWHSSDQVFHAEQALAGMSAGGARTVTFSTRWTVPELDVPSFYVRVAAVDPPNEFGQPRSAVYTRSCVYSAPRTLTRLQNLRMAPVKAMPIEKRQP